MHHRDIVPPVCLALSLLACSAAGPTEASSELLTVQAGTAGLVLTNRSGADSVFARASYKFTGVQSWMEVPVCDAPNLRLGPRERRVVPYAEVLDYGKPTDFRWAVVQAAHDCASSIRLTVRVPSR